MEKQEHFIQFRIDELTKNKFRNHCAFILDKPMSKVLKEHILKNIQPYEPRQSIEIESSEIVTENFEAITNWDYAPRLKSLLIDFIQGKDEENADLSDENLIRTYWELNSKGEIHLLFEWEHFLNRVKADWTG
jgi:hypothetical protein